MHTQTIRRRRSEAGLSLAEVLVATAIFAIIFIAALLIYDRSNQVFNRGVQSADMQQSTRIAFDKMVADLRMTGFDFDRDGLPAVSGQSQQPDEQIEYAGRSAITIRANFDYEDMATEGGRITALEIPNSEFPIVTTGNDEIVTYALVSDDASKNTDTITFFADVTDGSDEARQSYPGGAQEDVITITGVDLCDDADGCINPPYTLYRFTLGPDGSPTRTPLANNIRSMELNYFSNASGTTALTVTDAGGGRYDPANPTASAALRAVRSQIRSFQLVLIGMNEAQDGQYTNPNETLAAVQNFRTYRLESLISPRNIGKRGLAEQASAAPGVPTLDDVEFGYCGVVRLNWTQPVITPNTGLPDGYVLLWDTNVGATDQPINTRAVGVGTSGIIFGLDPLQEYRFSIAAVNSYGSTYSDMFVEGFPKNRTTPGPVTDVEATGGAGDPALDNSIEISWLLPTEYVSGEDILSAETPGGGVSLIQPAPVLASEFVSVEIWRDTDVNFQPPTDGTMIGTVSGSTTSFLDTTAAPCTTYYYRIRIKEACDLGTENVSASGISEFAPALASTAIAGSSISSSVPAAPANLQIDIANTSCSGSGICTVALVWPQVTTDDQTPATPLGVEQYIVEITQDGNPFDEEIVTPANGTFDTGQVRYSVTNLQQQNAGVDHEYEFVVRAVQSCPPAQESEPSRVVRFPICDFGSGAVITVDVANAFDAGSGETPWTVAGPSTITIGTDTDVPLASASAIAFHSGTGAVFADLGTTTGGTSAAFTWPAGATADAVYRIEFELTDTADCTTSGVLYIQEAAVPCGMVNTSDVTGGVFIAPPTTGSTQGRVQVKLLNEFGVNGAPAADLVITGVELAWDKDIAGVHANQFISSVTFPRQGGGTRITSTTPHTKTDPTEVWTASGTTANLVTADQTGNYTIHVNFNRNLNGAQPITEVTVFYRIANVDDSSVVRSCTIAP